MKILLALLSIFLFSAVFSFYSYEDECSHCYYKKTFENKLYWDNYQPLPYIHDKDSSLMIYPILENEDAPGYRYIQDIKFIYKDLHYCSDINKITIVNKDTSFSVISIRRMSCRINAVVRFSDNESKILKSIPTQKIIIENLVTDNIYEYPLKDSLYFINAYKKVN